VLRQLTRLYDTIQFLVCRYQLLSALPEDVCLPHPHLLDDLAHRKNADWKVGNHVEKSADNRPIMVAAAP
jgi:hypothetical protein